MSYASSRTSFTQHLAVDEDACTSDGSTTSRSRWSTSGDSTIPSLAGRERATPSETESAANN
ncbi:hypothetical protein EJB05_33751, partial [Eragrostis curvula]